jgi:hypothetical protein
VFFLGSIKTHENTSKHFLAVRWASFRLFKPDETGKNPSGWSGSKTRRPLAFLSGGWRQEDHAGDGSVLGGRCFHPKHLLKHPSKHTKSLAPNKSLSFLITRELTLNNGARIKLILVFSPMNVNAILISWT